MQSLIVFSQFRWDFALRRPQHLMTRLARDFRVFYFEEPVYDPRGAWLEIRVPAPNVHVCRPHTRITERGFADAQMPVLAELLENLISSHDLGTPVVWLYTPSALPLLQRLDAKTIIYDCIEEPSAPGEAGRELEAREHSLLKLADLVFTGGPSLFRHKQALHENVHSLPSSVDKDHFAAVGPGIDHPEQAMLAHPRFGFFGVIDQRFDPVAIALLADGHREWQVVLVGPIANIDLRSLPRRPNIHYMGERPYAELPQFISGWDVCLLPFAVNAATRFVSPAKVLEYMAAAKPIVTTALPDVIEPFGHIVHVGRHAQSFVSACEHALGESPAVREKRVAMMRNVVKATSWDATAEKMLALIDDVAHRQQKRRAPLAAAGAGTPEHRRTVVLGAGPAGLSTAYHLGKDCLLLEQHERVGGSCRSFEERGFVFDHGGHAMSSTDPYVLEMYAMLGSPGRGGLQSLMNGFLPQLRGQLRLDARVTRVLPSKHLLSLADGTSYTYEKLIATVPLPTLVDLLGEEAPTRVRRAACELRHQSSRWVYLGFTPGTPLHVPCRDFRPDQGILKRVVTLEGPALALEIPYSRRDPLPSDADALIDRCIAECQRIGVIDTDAAVVARFQFDLPFARVELEPGHLENVELIRHWLRARDIELAGEFAEWRTDPDHVFLAGKRAAEQVEDALVRKFRPSAPRPSVAQLRAHSTSSS